MKVKQFLTFVITFCLTSVSGFAQSGENSNPYAIFGGNPYIAGESTDSESVKVFVVENINEGSLVARLEHNTETGVIILFDADGNVIGRKQLVKGERAWPTIDPKAEKYYGTSPYVFTLNNPIRYIDPNGMDVWEIDYDGRVKWIEKSKQHTMYALNKDRERTGQSITIRDRSIFDQLTKQRDKKDYNGHYTISESKEIGDVFVFAADNTGVEWSLNGYKTDDNNQYVLSTSNDNDAVAVFQREGFGLENLLFDIHSHPGADGTPGASGNFKSTYAGDMLNIMRTATRATNLNITLPPHYVYHPNSKKLYHYTPSNSSIFIRRITNNQGLRFLFPK